MGFSSDIVQLSSTLPGNLLIVFCILFVVLAQYAAYCRRYHNIPKTSPKAWSAYHWPMLGSSIRFFSKRVDMVFEGRDASASGAFSIFVGTKHVVVLSGQDGRKTFFESKGLNLPQGFVELLTGRLSSARDEDYGLPYFSKALTELTRGHVLAKSLPIIGSDVRRYCTGLLAQSTSNFETKWRAIDIFSSIPLLMFKLMQRSVGATEIAEDDGLLRKSFTTFLDFERRTSTAHVIFPWLITPLHVLRLFTASRLYMRILKILNHRRKQGRREDDALQALIDKGEDSHTVVEFVFTVLAAGLTTTTSTTSWLIIFLAHSREWRERCREEVDMVLAAHRRQRSSTSSQGSPGQDSSLQTANDILGSLSLQEWESEFPILGICLRETIRITLPGAMFRRNASNHDIPIGDSGETIPSGSYAAYIVADTHENPELYPAPRVFDPSRWYAHTSDRQWNKHSKNGDGQVSKPEHAYIGWGSGRHMCVGMRLAKLQITLVMAHLLANFEFELAGGANASTRIPGPMPLPKRNAVRMEVPNEPEYVRYKPRE